MGMLRARSARGRLVNVKAAIAERKLSPKVREELSALVADRRPDISAAAAKVLTSDRRLRRGTEKSIVDMLVLARNRSGIHDQRKSRNQYRAIVDAAVTLTPSDELNRALAAGIEHSDAEIVIATLRAVSRSPRQSAAQFETALNALSRVKHFYSGCRNTQLVKSAGLVIRASGRQGIQALSRKLEHCNSAAELEILWHCAATAVRNASASKAARIGLLKVAIEHATASEKFIRSCAALFLKRCGDQIR